MRLFTKKLKPYYRGNRDLVVDAWWSKYYTWYLLPTVFVTFSTAWTVGFRWLKFNFELGIDEDLDARDVTDIPI